MSLFLGRRVLITGASSGLGKEFANQFHDLGANVVLVARRRENLCELTDSLNAKRQGSAQFLEVDLADQDNLEELCSFVEANRIDVLVNNAGFGSYGSFDTLDVARELNMIDVNCGAFLRLSHAVIPQMKSRRAGGIIFVSSIAGYQPLPYMTTYAATKAFDLFLALGLNKELSSYGIQVSALCPGPTVSEFGEVSGAPPTIATKSRAKVQKVVRDAIYGFRRGEAVVVPGIKAKVFAFLSRVLPFHFSTSIVARQLKN